MDSRDENPGRRSYGREKRRLGCSFRCGGEDHKGFVLDLSARGLFVQTAAAPDEGTEVRLTLDDVPGGPIVLIARVARRRASHRSLAAVEARGIGLRIESAPEAYFQLVLELTGEKPESDGL